MKREIIIRSLQEEIRLEADFSITQPLSKNIGEFAG